MDSNPFDSVLQMQRRLVLTPCATRQGLRQWLRFYLGLDFPDVRIDDSSTGSPMETFWEIYDAGVNRRPLKTDDGQDSRRALVYASRDSFKTRGAAALELLALLHMDRNVVHMAAIEQQAGKAQEYLRGDLERQFLDEFCVGNNKRTIAVLWFEKKDTGDILTNEEWKELGRNKKDYIRHVHYVKVIVNTAQSSNSDHTSFMVVDEADLIRFPKAYEEAKLIPSTQTDPYGRKQPPITLVTSSRKSGGGLVQKEIDESRKTKTIVRHWNVLDVTARCPETRHRPDLPKLKVWYSDETLRTYPPEEFETLTATDPKQAAKYIETEANAGCAKCSIFAACKGRLTTQSSTAGLLREVEDTIGKFDETSTEMAQAQLLCRKPGNEGSIYPRFSRETHMLDAAAMWQEVTGDPAPFGVNKDALINLFQSRGMQCVSGIDWGYTHCFAVTTGWVDGRRLFTLDAMEVPGLEPNQCVELCDSRIKRWNPTCWPDTAYPAYIKMFRKAGYQMNEHTKDVYGGIESVRAKLNPIGSAPPELFFLRNDEGCERLASRLAAYKWKLDAQGNPTDIPDDKNDDLPDAFRYKVQNVFRNAGKIVVAQQSAPVNGPVAPTAQNWMGQKIQELTAGQVGVEPVTLKKGKFFYSG